MFLVAFALFVFIASSSSLYSCSVPTGLAFEDRGGGFFEHIPAFCQCIIKGGELQRHANTHAHALLIAVPTHLYVRLLARFAAALCYVMASPTPTTPHTHTRTRQASVDVYSLGHEWEAFVVICLAGIIWEVICVLYLSPIMHPTHWFEGAPRRFC